jgi:hypothetical protein
MNAIHRCMMKLSILLGRKRFRSELDEEMAFHRDQAQKDLIAAGMTPEAAHYAAMRQFGNTTRLKEKSHEVVGFSFETVLQDLRFALRQLRKNPAFALAAILILALGIGASLSIFAFVDAALIKPLPYPNPTRLVDVTESLALFPRANLSYQDYLDWKRMNTVLNSFEVYTGTGYGLATPSGTEPVPGERVSAGFFGALGIAPMLGRDFQPADTVVGAAMLMGKLLFGVQAWDAQTLIAVALVLAASAMVASYIPARRAASVNPTEALRAE